MSTGGAPITLLPFHDSYSTEIGGWPQDAKEAASWTGNSTPFPVQVEEFQRWQVAIDENRTVTVNGTHRDHREPSSKA